MPKIFEQRFHRRVAAPRVGREPPPDELLQTTGHQHALGRFHHPAVLFEVDELIHRASDVGLLAVQRSVQRHAERELIGARVGGRSGVLLGRHEARGPDDRAGLGHGRREQVGIFGHIGAVAGVARVTEGSLHVRPRVQPRLVERIYFVDDQARVGARETKIRDACDPIEPHQDVVGLEVSMDEASLVRGAQATARLREGVDDLGEGARCLQPDGQRDALDELHRDEDRRPHGPDVEHTDHVRMRQLRDRLGFSEQAGPELTLVVRILCRRPEDLERDLSVELGVERRKHHAHPALPHLLEQNISADLLPRHERVDDGRSLGHRRSRIGAGIHVLRRRSMPSTDDAVDPRRCHIGVGTSRGPPRGRRGPPSRTSRKTRNR